MQPHSNVTTKSVPPMTKLYLMFLFLWQSTFKLSDVGMNILLKFLHQFLGLLAQLPGLVTLKKIISTLPTSVAAGKKLLGTNKDNFSKFVCCPSCSKLYPIENCIDRLPDGKVVSKTCIFVRFPHHPQQRYRKPCGTTLLKVVKTSVGTTSLYPRMLYCHRSLIESFQQLLLQPNFLSSCEKWRTRNVSENCFEDIYDGRIWKDFLDYDGEPFLSAPFNFALSLNVDWFQPFKRTNYSVGAIYMAIQNLPREERFLSENTILIGVIPGEPKNINPILEPLVEDLLKLWDGVVLKSSSQNSVLVRAALLCVTCDVPAARKVCGFLGHRANKACTKCLKQFPTLAFGEQPNYSGFNRESWPERSNESHRQHCIEHRACITKVSQAKIEREHGCRYSVLLQLPYFDPVRMCVIDPMHNLLLGTGRHMIAVWKELKLINDSDLDGMQEKVNSFVTPDDVGRIPSKIASSFSGFTAEQWRNWILIFSQYSLKEVLPYQHYKCWHLFVKACYAFCRRSIRLEDVEQGDKFIIEFCNKFQDLYGERHCNINLHLHTHLASCILEFGPVYSFWLFAFERMNGILGAFHTNCRDVPLQLMRRFMQVSEYGLHYWPEEYKDDFSPLIADFRYCKGSLIPTSLESALAREECTPLPPLYEQALSSSLKSTLLDAFCKLKYFPSDFTLDILSLYQKCKSVKLGRFILGSNCSRHKTASIVLVQTLQDNEIKLAEIQYYIKCYVKVSSPSTTTKSESFWFAAVALFQPHDCAVWYGSPVQVWSQVTSVDILLVPVSHIKCRSAYASASVNFGRVIGHDNVLIVVPLVNDIHYVSD